MRLMPAAQDRVQRQFPPAYELGPDTFALQTTSVTPAAQFEVLTGFSPALVAELTPLVSNDCGNAGL